jgi:hypothetical protein
MTERLPVGLAAEHVLLTPATWHVHAVAAEDVQRLILDFDVCGVLHYAIVPFGEAGAWVLADVPFEAELAPLLGPALGFASDTARPVEPKTASAWLLTVAHNEQARRCKFSDYLLGIALGEVDGNTKGALPEVKV